MFNDTVKAMTLSLEAAGWPLAEEADLGPALSQLIRSRPTPPRLLALGEPTHLVEEFPRLRNAALRHLVEHEGYRSVALESAAPAGLAVDAYAADGTGSLDEVLHTGYHPELDALDANRELVGWLRQHNRTADVPVRFYGFDPPIEMMWATSPAPALRELHAYLSAVLGERVPTVDIDGLTGPEERWTDPAIVMDAALSVGTSPDAVALRLLADDLLTLLHSDSPPLVAATSHDAWWRAGLHGRTAAGLLRYHAAMAEPAPSRLERMCALRDTMMAENLRAILDREADRGPTLVFAHNSHLQREESSMQLGPYDLRWWSAGAIVATQLGAGYAFVATMAGCAPGRDLHVPGPDTLEGTLAALPADGYLFDSRRLAAALDGRALVPRDTTPEQGWGSFDPTHLTDTDGLVHLREVHAESLVRR